MIVPFVDLKAQYEEIKKEINSAIGEVLRNTSFILGPAVERFEENYAQFLGSRHCIGTNSGTSAIMVALMAAGVQAGDEVITVPNSFIATVEPIVLLGAKPVFVDVDEVTRNIDVSKINSVVTTKTKAIIPVHLYGHPVDMDPILKVSHKYNLIVIEDAAQAHAAKYKGKKTGSIGNIGCFSFYPGKNLGAYGEGGMLSTDDDDIAEKAKIIRDHGSVNKYNHVRIGLNARMSGLQGAILDVKLKYLEMWTTMRRRNAQFYNQLLKSNDVLTPFEADYARHVYHIYAIQTKKRSSLQDYLKSRKVGVGVHYPNSLHLEKSLSYLGHRKGDFPVSEKLANEVLSLPMYPELKREQIEYVAQCIVDSG